MEKTFVEHSRELRSRLLVSLGLVVLFSIVSYYFADSLLQFLLKPIRADVGRIYFFSPAGAFLVKLKIALLSGFITASPVIISQLWRFIAPGLYDKEKRYIAPIVGATSCLFLVGALFALVVVIPVAMKFLIGFQSEILRPMISVTEYISFITTLLLAFGIAFNLPVFLIALAFLRIIKSNQLAKYRKHALIIMLIGSAILTPPDLISQLMLTVPLILLYEISIWGAKFIEFKRA